MQRIFLAIAVVLITLSACQHNVRPTEQQQLATCGDPHRDPASQWQGCSRNRDCTQVCGSGWGCGASDGYCHDH